MNPFKSFCLTWWQAGLWKIGVVSFGLLIGANWPKVFAPRSGWLLAMAALAGGYAGIVWLGQ